MKKITLGAALFASVAIAAPAQAGVTLDVGSSSTLTSKNNVDANKLDGPDGNKREYKSADAGKAFTMTATAWTISYNSSNIGNSIVNSSFLGVYTNNTSATDGGFGVTNRWEGNGGNNTHTIDNGGTNSQGRQTYDFVLLQFDRQVSLTEAFFDSFGDTDTTVRYGNVYGNPPAWDGVNYSTITNALTGLITINSNSNSGDGFQTIAGNSGIVASTWMIGGLFPTASLNDSYKLSAVKVTVPVPEPATWALMILGFGFIGATMRQAKRRSQDALRLA